jgi:hypothetical protein
MRAFLSLLLYEVFKVYGALAKLRKRTMSFVISVRPSVCLPSLNNSAPTGRIFMKFYIEDISKIGRGNSSFVKSHKNEGCFT